MDKRFTIEIYRFKSDTCYASFASTEAKQDDKSYRSFESAGKTIRCDILELLYEGLAIQERLRTLNTSMNIGKISSKFKQLMQKGNVNGALKFLTNNMSNGILPLTEATLQLLELKHPDAREASPDVMLAGPVRQIHPVVFEDIDEALVLKAVMKTKGGSGPSGLDADGWRRILASNANATSDFRKSIALFIRKLCTETIEVKNDEDNASLEAFVACRLSHLGKKPGLRPIGVGEVLRIIAGKVVMCVVKKYVTSSWCVTSVYWSRCW